MPKAQEILDKTYKTIYPEVDTIDISSRNLGGDLKLEGFVNLKKLDCSNNKIASLEIVNCPKLKKVICNRNELTRLNLSNLGKLIELHCNNNQLLQLDLQNCIKLELKQFRYDDKLLKSVSINFGSNEKLKKEV